MCLSLLIHIAIYLIDHRSTSFLILAVIVSVAALGGMVFVFGLAMRPEWIYAHFAITLSAGFTLGYEVVAEIPGERYPVLIYEKGAQND